MKSGGRVVWWHDSNNPLRAQVVSHEYRSPVLQWASQITFVKDGISWQCCVPGLSKDTPKKHHIYLEDASGKKVGSVVALQEPDMLHQQFKTMACVRYIFAFMILHHNMNGKDMTVVCLSNWSSGWKGLCCTALNIWCSTISMAGSDARVEDTYKKYLDACLATRVHFNSHPKDSPTRHQTIVCFGPKIMRGGCLPASMLTSTLFIHSLGRNSANSPSSQPLFAKDSFCSSGCKQNRDFVRAQGASSRRPRQRLSMTFQNASYALTSQSVHPRCWSLWWRMPSHPVPWKRRSQLPLPLHDPVGVSEHYVIFRNPNWVVSRKPLRSSCCTQFSFSIANSHKPWTSEGCGHRRSNGHQALAFGSPVTKEVLGQGTFSCLICLCAAPILQQFVYHYRKEVGVCFSLHGDVVRCGDAQVAGRLLHAYCMLIASVLWWWRAFSEGLLGTFLYLLVHCRRLWRGVQFLARVDNAPLQCGQAQESAALFGFQSPWCITTARLGQLALWMTLFCRVYLCWKPTTLRAQGAKGWHFLQGLAQRHVVAQ